MGWATRYIEKLTRGETVQFRPRGNDKTPQVGDIVLCRVNGTQYLHLVKAVSGERFQIGNNRGRINGWTARRNIFGICSEISR
jgi:hypothetical protein